MLFVHEDPIAAYDIAEGIIDVIGRDPRMPDVRVGLASGSVVMRLGDVFGPPVNLAARLTAVARRNRVIVDAGHGRPAARRPVRDPAAAGPARCAASGSSSRSPYAGTEARSIAPAGSESTDRLLMPGGSATRCRGT